MAIDSENELKTHDKTVTRLILILSMLDEKERPTQQELAEEFGVSLRTIQRDVGQRLGYFPIEKTRDGRLFFTDGFSLKRTSFKDIEMVLLSLSLSMVMDVSPQFSKTAHSLLGKLLIPSFSSPFLIKQDPYEKIDIDSLKINELEFAIENKRITNIKIAKQEFNVEPYKIVSFDEIWYLFAKDIYDDKIKTFFISDILYLEYKAKVFKAHKNIDKILQNANTAWFEDGISYEVKVHVMKEIAHYFKKKKHFASQKLIRENHDGSLILSFTISHDEEIDNIIKSWLPHISVISPKRLRKKMINELEEYIKVLKTINVTQVDI